MHSLEWRRQIFHILYGPLIVLLHFYGWLTLEVLVGIIVGGSVMSLMVKKEKASLVKKFLSYFEREHHLQNFPGRGILFFTIGAFLSLWLFSTKAAYAGILILSVGDGLSNLIGRHWGRVKMALNPHKYIEGTVVGLIASVPIAYYFFDNIAAAVASASIAMFLEMPCIRIFGYEIDDNLLIPVAASFTLDLFA